MPGWIYAAEVVIFALLLPFARIVMSEPFVIADRRDFFDVFKAFSPSGTSNYRTLTLDGDTLFIGARDKVYGQDPADIEQARFREVAWPTSEDDSCRTLPQSQDGQKCFNLIQIVQPLNKTHVLICGTNSLTPQNRLLFRENENELYKLIPDTIVRSPLCSFDPSDSISYLKTPSSSGGTIFSTPRSDLQAKISVVKTMPDSLLMCNENMQEENFNFVASFYNDDNDKVYFFSDEKAGEQGGKPSYTATVTQVCSTDIGGKNILANQWTSLLKLRLLCQTTAGFPLVFDLVTHVVQGSDGIIYGTFTTRHEEYRTNAVCSFRLSDIQEAFSKNTFWEKDQKTGTYKTVQPPDNSLQPGMCAYRGMLESKPAASTSKEFPPSHLTFMSEHNLVTDVVKPAYPPSADGSIPTLQKGPLFTKYGDTFTKIAVDTVTDLGGTTHDVIFVGTHKGYAYKFISVVKDNKVETVELAKYIISSKPVISMELSKEHNMLYVGTDNGVHQVSTGNCAAYTKTCEFCDPCRMCILSRDPYCAWDDSAKECVSLNVEDKRSLRQDVSNGGAVTQCGLLARSTSPSTTVKVTDGTKQILGDIVKNGVVHCDWYKVENENKREKIDNKVGKFRITTDCQLEISDFNAGMDAGNYECDYKAHGTIVNMADYNVRSSAWVPPKTWPPVLETTTRPSIPKNPNGNSTMPGMTYAPPIARSSDPTTTEESPVASGSSVTTAIIAILVVIFLLAIVLLCFCFRQRICPRQKTAKDYDAAQKEKMEELERAEVPDGNDSSPVAHDNATNNNNAQLLGFERINSNREDAEEPLLRGRVRCQIPLSATPQHMPSEKASTSRNPRGAQSLDFLDRDDTMDYIDEAQGATASARKNSTLEQSSSLREEGGRKRVPPARTKSMPGSTLYVVFAGKKLQCSTLQRNKQGNWMIEVPNQSGMSDMVGVEAEDDDDDIIEIMPDDSNNHDTTVKFSPSHDNVAQPSGAPKSGGKKPAVDKQDIATARNDFFLNKRNGNSPTVNYMTSTPNRAPPAPHLFQSQKTPLGEQSSKASSRSSHNSSEDSDSTVKGSCSTLKPEDTPLVTHPKELAKLSSKPLHKHRHHRGAQGQASHGPSSDMVRAPLALREASHHASKESLGNSSGSSDGDSEQLHGRDKKTSRKSRNKPPDSPSKESRTSQGSSSGSDYKSARSSVISDNHDNR